MAMIQFNGRNTYVSRIVEVEQTRAGTFVGKLDGDRAFKIEGGRARGGTSREWFVYCDAIFSGGPVFCTSAREGLRILDNT